MTTTVSQISVRWQVVAAGAALICGMFVGRSLPRSSLGPPMPTVSITPLMTEHRVQAKPDLFQKRVNLLERIPTLDAASLEAAMKDGRTPLAMMAPIANRWATIDPQGMFRFLMESKSPSSYWREKQAYPFDILFKTWAGNDLQSALDATRQWFPILDDPIRKIAMTEIVDVMMANDAGDTLRFMKDHRVDASAIVVRHPKWFASQIHHLPTSLYRTDLIQKVADAWAKRDPDAVLAWAGTLDARAAAIPISSIISDTLKSSPALAAQQFNSHAMDGRFYDLAREIADAYGTIDPEAAFHWADRSLVGGAHTHSIDRILDLYVMNDPVAAAEFAISQPDESRQQVIHSVASQWVGYDSAAALHWADRSGDEEVRASFLQAVNRKAERELERASED